ncbi:MAG: hypothetical protein J6J43_05485 [Oscillospiraceae bacterium]|nr:hypothetical protein [Oscillospiraceae bacterium]
MTKLVFTTTGAWEDSFGFGCASLGLPGICANDVRQTAAYGEALEGQVLTGTYEQLLRQAAGADGQAVHAAIVVFGNMGGENRFLADLQQHLHCPMVGGGAAIDPASGRKSLIPGGGEAAVFLVTDDRFTYETKTLCIHDRVLQTCELTFDDPRTIHTINGEDAAAFYDRKRRELGLSDTDFEHLTLSDLHHVNAHLSIRDGKLRSGRDVQKTMLLRYVDHNKVYDTMRNFYDDPDAIVFGCAGLSGLLDRPLDTTSLGLFLFGEVCMADGCAEFGNLMLSKLLIRKKGA